MRILIKSAAVNERRIVSRKSGQQVTFREQAAALDNGADFPSPFTLNLGDDQAPYAPGHYTLDPSSLYVDGQYNKLTVGRVKLIPLAAPSPGAK